MLLYLPINGIFLESCLKVVVTYYFKMMDLKRNQIWCDLSVYKTWHLPITAILRLAKCVIVDGKEPKSGAVPDWECPTHPRVMAKGYLVRSLDQSPPLQLRDHPSDKLRVEVHFIHLHLRGLRTTSDQDAPSLSTPPCFLPTGQVKQVTLLLHKYKTNLDLTRSDSTSYYSLYCRPFPTRLSANRTYSCF